MAPDDWELELPGRALLGPSPFALFPLEDASFEGTVTPEPTDIPGSDGNAVGSAAEFAPFVGTDPLAPESALAEALPESG